MLNGYQLLLGNIHIIKIFIVSLLSTLLYFINLIDLTNGVIYRHSLNKWRSIYDRRCPEGVLTVQSQRSQTILGYLKFRWHLTYSLSICHIVIHSIYYWIKRKTYYYKTYGENFNGMLSIIHSFTSGLRWALNLWPAVMF